MTDFEALAAKALADIQATRERLGLLPHAAEIPSAADQARQHVSHWLDAHHTPTRSELEYLRAALHAATLENAQHESLSKVGAKLAAQAQEVLAAGPATDSRGNELIGMLAKFRATWTAQMTQITGQRGAVVALLKRKGTEPKAGPRFRGKKRGAN